jgi:hypothetical protein
MEAAFGAAFGVVFSYLLVFGLDRIIDTPGWLRLVLLGLGLMGGLVILPMQLSRWIGGNTTLKAVAQRIAREDITIGDRILGVMELTENKEEFTRSPELSLAAINQGEEDLRGRDLSHTLPSSRHMAWGAAALVCVGASAVGFLVVPEAAQNAFARWMQPMAGIERFTFARLAPFDDHMVVARHEPFTVSIQLATDTDRLPEFASLTGGGGESLEAQLVDGGYQFDMAGLGGEANYDLRVGDYRGTVLIDPKDRPEVSGMKATVFLPAYLELPDSLERDARGGSVRVVSGSSVAITADLTRELDSTAWTAGISRAEGSQLITGKALVTDSFDTALTWRDNLGLEGVVPFQLALKSQVDAKPTVILEGLQAEMILLYNQATSFSVRTNDDFGVREVGLVWEGLGDVEGHDELASGEKLLGLGGPDASNLELTATLHPRLLEIDPQTLRVRAFAVDSLPDRERSYSAPILVQVMTEEDHMIWLTRNFASWYDEAVEVRDEENNLLQTNEEMLALPNDELATAEMQRKIQVQAAAERVNSRRLNRLVGSGSTLLAEAARNPQFNANTMDDWAEMMSALKDISDTRMPSVAELLGSAAAAEKTKVAGVNRDSAKPSSGPSKPEEGPEKLKLPNAPQVADVESSFNEPTKKEGDQEAKPASSGPPANLTLAQTTVEGGGATQKSQPPAPDTADDSPGPTKDELAKAIAEQRALMVEFQKVAGVISETLANLEGSTFVKRLKALSRSETGVAQDLDGTLASAFGADEVGQDNAETVAFVSGVQEKSGQRASLVREDLTAYIGRMGEAGRDTSKFERVLEEMGDVGVTREMAAIDDLSSISRAGEAIAGAENLADDLDRWAEILVGPG